MMKGHIYIYLLGILLLSVSCTGKFREFNTVSRVLRMRIW